MSNNTNTLLCRFYGLHRVKLPRGKKIHFVVMGNVFPPNKDVHETYDLKVSFSKMFRSSACLPIYYLLLIIYGEREKGNETYVISTAFDL